MIEKRLRFFKLSFFGLVCAKGCKIKNQEDKSLRRADETDSMHAFYSTICATILWSFCGQRFFNRLLHAKMAALSASAGIMTVLVSFYRCGEENAFES